MKTITALLILTIFFTASHQLSAQIKKANSLFDQYRYSKAIPYYEKATEDRKMEIRTQATVRLADCYRLMNNAKEARTWYAKAVLINGVDPINYYYLGMALRNLSNYQEAEKAFLHFAEKAPSDLRGKIYAQYCRDIKQWDGLTPSAEIKNAQALNSPYSDFGPMYYKDGLIITSDRDIDMLADQNYMWTSFGYLDLFLSEPSWYKDFWREMGTPDKLPDSFNQSYHDGPASFSSDYSQIFITRTLKNSSKKDSANLRTDLLKIFYANLDDLKKIVYTAFPYNSEDYSVGHPTLSKDGKKLIFSSNKPGGTGQSDLYISELINGKWNKPVNLGSVVNTFGNEVFPFLANDSTLYFSSDGHLGFGGLDLFESKLVDGKWTTPWNLKLPLNSPYDDFSLVMNKEMTDGFFSSNRPGGLGSDDLYAFRNYKRTPEQPNSIPIPLAKAKNAPGSPMISGFVKDKSTLAPIDSATVFVLNTVTAEVLVLKTNSDGYFETPVTLGDLYVTKAMKPNFFDDCLNFRFAAIEPSLNLKTPRDLLLDQYALNQVFVIENIYYDLDKWFIREDAKPALDNLVRILTQYPISVELGSHTDSRASFEYNIRLSQMRAEAAVNYLTSNGINSTRMTAKGYGEMIPVNRCIDGMPCSETEHQANRRTEFKITAINSNLSNKSTFDPNIFKSGDKIPVRLLDADFFKGCLENKVIAELNTPIAKPEPVKQQIIPQAVKNTPAPEIKKPAPVTEVVQLSDSSDDIWFTVQLAASLRPITETSDFKGESNIQEKKIGVYFKYFVKSFTTLNQASAERKRLIQKFPGAFVVAFKGMQPISLFEAKKLKGIN